MQGSINLARLNKNLGKGGERALGGFCYGGSINLAAGTKIQGRAGRGLWGARKGLLCK